MSAGVQTPALDRTKGPVGLSGTVLETKAHHPRVPGDMAALVITIACNEIRCHVTKLFDNAKAATSAQRQVPVGSHLTAFGEARDLQLRHGELHLTTQRLITYSLVSDFTQRNMFSEVA